MATFSRIYIAVLLLATYTLLINEEFFVGRTKRKTASAHYYIDINVVVYSLVCQRNSLYVTGPDKTGLITLFCISRNMNFNIECTVLLWWLDTVTPDILYNKCSYIAIIS